MWQPIESIPKNTSVLLACEDEENGYTVVTGIKWGDGFALTCGALILSDTTVKDGYMDRPRSMEPTHWMPLPEAPE